jgi:hypothetical protein
VAGAIAAAGDPGRAETVARSIIRPFEQAEALAAVAGAIAATGDTERARQLAEQAETVARSITYPPEQARALTAVAEAIAAAGDPERAGRALGAALAVESWRVPLSVLARHWPQVVLRCADELSGSERS